jgi:hypothetical protein
VTTLWIANTRTEDMVGDLATLTDEERRFAGAGSQRMAWLATNDDVVVVPWLPGDDYVDYVTALTGTDRATLRMLAPPPGALGEDILSPDRLAGADFRARLRDAIAGREVRQVAPVLSDSAVVDLAKAVGVLDALPGHEFSAQGGCALVNSKAVFRAIAAGIGAAIARGTVAARPAEAVVGIEELLAAGHPVIVKVDHQAGGAGNEVLSRIPGVRPLGARQVVPVPDRRAVEDYVERNWAWLTGNRHDRVIIERYYPESVPVYVEFMVTDDGVALLGHGQMTMNPVLEGVIAPAVALTPAEATELVAMGRRMCEPYRQLGYRGVLTPDVIVTPERELLFSEVNGRISGATHLYTAVAECLGGPSALSDRVIVERGGWRVPSFGAAVDRLETTGLGLDPVKRVGVVLVCDMSRIDGTVRYCVIGEDLAAARERERELIAQFATTPA